eukprot:5280842-Pyramimonas_sp.AAC.1
MHTGSIGPTGACKKLLYRTDWDMFYRGSIGPAGEFIRGSIGPTGTCRRGSLRPTGTCIRSSIGPNGTCIKRLYRTYWDMYTGL